MSYVVPVKSKVKISQTFAAFSEYMNFIEWEHDLGEKLDTYRYLSRYEFWNRVHSNEKIVHYKGKGSAMENGDAVPTELKERRSTVDFGDKGLPLLS